MKYIYQPFFFTCTITSPQQDVACRRHYSNHLASLQTWFMRYSTSEVSAQLVGRHRYTFCSQEHNIFPLLSLTYQLLNYNKNNSNSNNNDIKKKHIWTVTPPPHTHTQATYTALLPHQPTRYNKHTVIIYTVHSNQLAESMPALIKYVNITPPSWNLQTLNLRNFVVHWEEPKIQNHHQLPEKQKHKKKKPKQKTNKN